MSVRTGKQTTIRISSELWERLNKATERTVCGRNLVLETALTLGMDEFDLLEDDEAQDLCIETKKERGGKWPRKSK